MNKRIIEFAFATIMGWYLLEPNLKFNSQFLPIGLDLSAQLTEWMNVGAFDTASACEEQKLYDERHHPKCKGENVTAVHSSKPEKVDPKDWKPATGKELEDESAKLSCIYGNQADRAAECIETDDPRLAEKK